MMPNEGKWLVALEGVEYWYNDTAFDTKEEAISHGRSVLREWNDATTEGKGHITLSDELSNHYDDDIDNVYTFVVGKVERVSVSINAEQIINLIAENTCSDADLPETLEDFLINVDNEHIRELETLVEGWINKHKYEPKAFTISEASVVKVYDIENEVTE